ncbi:MAG: RNA polymerase sigma-70 factor ECF subfamily [Elusimicrobia bacterium]|nr:MAG: RNA polymerase sigma-70 factor ECF subfamily [Elusimicrobiota bacterium]KAF0156877.1 MAG: RNA polymerase sigma-70 factor ECF subfamily [Elusimicrobiota bacterium]
MSEERKPDLPEDFDLIAAFNGGDESAFARIVEKYAGRLINFLYRYTRDRGTAEDLAQETFLRLYRASPALEPRAALSTIIFRFAYNLAVDSGRRAASRYARAPVSSLDAASERGLDPAGDASPEQLMEKAQGEEAAAAALGALPDSQRTAILLRVYEDRSYAEIAEIMNLTVPSVESLLFRARQTLAKKLKR